MNILIDIGHPAHVHYFRILAGELVRNGNLVFWCTKDIPIVKQLLNSYGFEYIVLPQKSDTLPGKIGKQFFYNIKLLQFCFKKKITLVIGVSVTAAHISKISKIKSFVFDDDDDLVQPLVTKYVIPFCTELLSPDSLKGKRNRKDTVFYPGFHELAYLHPTRFEPDPSVLQECGLKGGEPFFIFRFNVFKAHHDNNIRGLSLEQKLRLIHILEKKGRIFITTERDIEPELSIWQLRISPEKMHSLLAYATLFVSDSQTMTSEAAMLGVPALRCNSFAGRLSTLEEQEKQYGLTYAFLPDDFDRLLEKLTELLAIPDLKSEWHRRRIKLLNDKIDVTSFWLWFIEYYPDSKLIMQEYPAYADRFR
jgi:predicted glycosyltransferase